MKKEKIVIIICTVIFFVVIYLYLMLMLDEKSIGLYESIIEVEDMDSLKKVNELAKVSQQKRDIVNFKYIYGTIIISYLCGVIYWFGLKKK